MKTNSFLRMALGCLFVSFAMCNTSCDSEESVIPEKPTPVNPENVDSNVDFEIKNENGAGEGTPSSPAQVFSDTLNMVISQKSVIKDTQGRVLFECEPKAKVNISSQSDTIFVSDKNQLMQVESKVDVKTSQSGTSPVLKKTLQTFNLGEQKIQFDLQNEVFYYVTEDKQKIEMPYPLLHNAKSGKYVAEEMVTRSEYRVVPAAVEIEAIASSRATKTDTTMYNVKAKFNLEVEAKNVKNTKKQPLEFVVNYVGAVIDTTHIPDPDIDSGNVVYSTEIKGADGTGSLTSPIQVNGKKTAQVIFNQKSSFADSGNKVFECNPKASIELYAQLDTVRVTNKDLLFEVTKNAEEKVSQSGENPIQNLKTQIFKLGGNQSINVKTAYEVCKYMTNAQQNIDMPCILLNGAKLGSSASKENTDVSEIVTIKEITTTRASVTDSTLYSVKVKCSLQYETVNTKKAESKTLDFEVNYMAVVSTTTEYPEPEPDSGDVEVSTEFQGGKGNGSVSSPFVVDGNSASVTLSQKSSFTDFDGSIFKCEPKATATISVPFDTLYVKDASELTYVNPKATAKTSEKGKNPTTTTTSVTYKIAGGKTIDFGLDYETYNYKMKSGKTIEMAHYKWNTPNFGKASAMTLKNVQKTRAIVRNREVYDIVATFGLNAESVNTQNVKKQEMNFEVHYTGVVETEASEPEFVKAEYRRDYEWVEPHHNMHLMHVAKVYRDRYYSNGDVKTDTFVDNGHPNISGLGLFPEGSGYLYVEEKEKPDSVRYSEVTEILNDSVCISKRTTYVPNLASVKYVEEDLGNNGVKIEELGRYTPSKIYNDEAGWYAMSIKYNKRVIFKYGYANIAIMDLQPMFANQYLKIDGQIIDFADWAPVHNWSLNKEDIPASGSNGPGMKYTYECHTTFMGRNFILQAEVTFIQEK